MQSALIALDSPLSKLVQRGASGSSFAGMVIQPIRKRHGGKDDSHSSTSCLSCNSKDSAVLIKRYRANGKRQDLTNSSSSFLNRPNNQGTCNMYGDWWLRKGASSEDPRIEYKEVNAALWDGGINRERARVAKRIDSSLRIQVYYK